VLFDTLSGGVRRPIYFRPSVIFVARLGLYAVAFGTGQRDNLWTFGAAGGERFYTFVDDSAEALVALPYDEADLLPIRLTDASALGANYLEDRVAGQRGWYLVLDASRNERLVTPPLTLSGLLFFSTYSPFLESTPDPTEPKLTVCEKRGDSRSYSVFAFNGSGAGFDAQGRWARYKDIDDVFVSEPFVEQFQTGNTGTGSSASPLPGNFDFDGLMDELKTQLFSPRCHFNPAYRFDIRTVRSDTGVEYLGSVPLCLLPSNWRPED
jgi:Tfp pilus tip-associated adhesin PilY1